MTSNVHISCVIFIVLLDCINSTLLSRYRNLNEYVSPSESLLLQQLPDDMFDSLLLERPDMKDVLLPIRRARLRHPALLAAHGAPSFHEQYSDAEGDERDAEPALEPEPETEPVRQWQPARHRQRQWQRQLAPEPESETEPVRQWQPARHRQRQRQRQLAPEPAPKLARAAAAGAGYVNATRNTQPVTLRAKNNSTNLLPFGGGSSGKISRRNSPYKASCYMCNRWENTVPINPYCYKAFETDDWRARTLARYYRINCYYNSEYFHENSFYNWKGPVPYKYEGDKGLRRWYYGHYTGGCYKRFLDLGEVYTSRGCRAYWPDMQKNLLAHRFRRLELMLWKRPDGCISSPAASLTPLSRGISIFTRYHVCICRGKWCNAAPLTASTATLVFILSLIFVYFL
ncbi:unnamed protein product [Chrysodeixis includens]|uniref:Uncharacterized protein n=1 Tax=Chrysodeixis includens TaxID=689277 RepID=A0A9P0BRK5_CHRIL|nr:unnamed protein product [Chrysodeixis includens]